MESYCNMNSSNGRNYQNPMNQSYRNSMKQGCNQCSVSRSPQNPGNYSGRQRAGSCSDGQKRMMHDSNGRSMEVKCVCKATPKKNCSNDDPMEKLGNQFPTVMAYVPWQQWGELYDADCGLMQGTIFKELNLIFCGVRC